MRLDSHITYPKEEKRKNYTQINQIRRRILNRESRREKSSSTTFPSPLPRTFPPSLFPFKFLFVEIPAEVLAETKNHAAVNVKTISYVAVAANFHSGFLFSVKVRGGWVVAASLNVGAEKLTFHT